MGEVHPSTRTELGFEAAKGRPCFHPVAFLWCKQEEKLQIREERRFSAAIVQKQAQPQKYPTKSYQATLNSLDWKDNVDEEVHHSLCCKHPESLFLSAVYVGVMYRDQFTGTCCSVVSAICSGPVWVCGFYNGRLGEPFNPESVVMNRTLGEQIHLWCLTRWRRPQIFLGDRAAVISR